MSRVARILEGRGILTFKGRAGVTIRYLFRTRRERVEIEACRG
jgi:hypothetical protein